MDNRLLTFLIVAGLSISAGIGYLLHNESPIVIDGDSNRLPLDGNYIRIGYITSTVTALEKEVPLVEQIMVPDYTAFVRKLNYDVTIIVSRGTADNQTDVHLQKLKGFRQIDNNAVISSGTSSQIMGSLDYVNNNNMLLWSSSATSHALAISNDNLFRMCTDDVAQAAAIAEMLKSYGINAVIVIQRGDAWADGIYDSFEQLFTSGGGVIIDKIRYSTESTNFSNYLDAAENSLFSAVEKYGRDHMAVEVIASQEAVKMVEEAAGYPTLYSLPWFGCDGTAAKNLFIDDAPQQSSHVHLYSPIVAPTESLKFKDVSSRYYEITSQPLDYYSACAYDIGWIIIESMLDSQIPNPNYWIPLQESIASNSFGASGWNKLNDAGDRAVSDYLIWGYGDLGDGVQNVNYGLYEGETNSVIWYTLVLGFTP